MKIGVVDIGGGLREIYAAGVLDYPALRDDSMEFYVVAADALTGEPKYFDKGDIRQDDYSVLKASSTIPFVCRPYVVQGRPTMTARWAIPSRWKKRSGPDVTE